MEPKNQPIERENHLPNLHFGFHVNFPGCIYIYVHMFFFADHEVDRYKLLLMESLMGEGFFP